MKYGLRAPVGACEGIWIATASENSDAGGWRCLPPRQKRRCWAPPALRCPAGAARLHRRQRRSPSPPPRSAARCAGRRFLLLFRRDGKRWPVLPRLLRAHVVPSDEERDRVGVVNGLNRDRRRRRMELASGLGDLSDDREAGDTSGLEARGPFGQIDRIVDVPRNDKVGIAGSLVARQRGDEVGDGPQLFGLQRIHKRWHRRAVQPRAHRPEDVLTGRSAPERPALCEVRRAYRVAPVVLQRRRRRSVTSPERAVTLTQPVSS